MKKAVILTNAQAEYKMLVEKYNLPDIDLHAPETQEELLMHLKDAEIIFANPIRLSKYINQAENVKWVQSTFAGIDALNNNELQKNYTLTNMKDTYGEIISEYILGYILMLEKDILGNIKHQQNKNWAQKCNPSLVGKKIGIMGVGSIGGVIAAYCKNFGMQVYGYASEERLQENIDKIYTSNNKDDFLNDLDYLVNVLPNTQNTQGIINKDLLAKLPSKAVLINVGRGANVVEDDLIDAIKDKTIAGAVLDVFQVEPLPKDSELWSLGNVYITPHVSGYVEDNSKIIQTFAENYMLYVKGKDLMHTIDFKKGY